VRRRREREGRGGEREKLEVPKEPAEAS